MCTELVSKRRCMYCPSGDLDSRRRRRSSLWTQAREMILATLYSASSGAPVSREEDEVGRVVERLNGSTDTAAFTRRSNVLSLQTTKAAPCSARTSKTYKSSCGRLTWRARAYQSSRLVPRHFSSRWLPETEGSAAADESQLETYERQGLPYWPRPPIC